MEGCECIEWVCGGGGVIWRGVRWRGVSGGCEAWPSDKRIVSGIESLYSVCLVERKYIGCIGLSISRAQTKGFRLELLSKRVSGSSVGVVPSGSPYLIDHSIAAVNLTYVQVQYRS